MDELIGRLEKSGVGCKMGIKFFGSFGYADDLKIISPSIRGLQKMLNICEIFGDEYDVTFNAKKTFGICYSNNECTDIRPIYLNGTVIKWQNNVKYLGNILSHDLSDAADIKFKKGSFIGAVNKLNYVFSSVDSFTKVKLLQTYCTSWYGCQSWQIRSQHVDQLNVEWRKAVRRTLALPARTRSSLLPALAGNKSFCQQHHSRVTNFIASMRKSKNESVEYIIKRAHTNTIGPLGKNIVYLNVFSSVDRDSPVSISSSRIDQIRELIRARDGLDQLNVLNRDEINDILNYLCTF